MPTAKQASKRIALVIHALYGGGAERLMSQLATRWSDDHQVHLITWSSVQSDEYSVPRSVQRHGLDLMRHSSNALMGLFANYRRVARLRASLHSIEPDLILSFSDQMNIVTLEAARKLRIQGQPIPTWISEHSNPEEQRLSPLWERWRSRVYPNCTGCVVLTPAIATYMQKWMAGDKLHVIPPAVTNVRRKALNDWNDRAKKFLFVGRLSQEKRVDLLLHAWQLAASQLPDWSLDIVGDGPEKQGLTKLAQSLPRVHFHGWIRDQDKLNAIYQDARFSVLTSKYEGFPVTLLEALSRGLPGIATDCSSALQLLNQKHPVIRIIETDSPECIASNLTAAAANLPEGDSLGKLAQQVAREYDWPIIGQQWDRILSQS